MGVLGNGREAEICSAGASPTVQEVGGGAGNYTGQYRNLSSTAAMHLRERRERDGERPSSATRELATKRFAYG
jgi:hypothetical protein